MTTAATIYIVNYVLVIWLAHSPLTQSDDPNIYLNTALNGSLHMTSSTLLGCAQLGRIELDREIDAAGSCVRAAASAVQAFRIDDH